ncbi:hypothetical protein DVA67_000205 [Solirubrobacter sp. CPCC 204708]|uniref:Bacterial Ig-like domain-containing protein n=1 Tax=Solirubrobacter deserti TaxID=2282478 RepID=A0ABT4RTA7_9ACTN|nr:hypothetical protein [Solirubrobacter deserti]MBE2314379.1 hypothetical protein [Solirubrobacter deserti]MDA0141475.1 hypothetical protein [Solirubrobacter deserti]
MNLFRLMVVTLAFAGVLAGTAHAQTRIDDGPVRLTNDPEPVFSFTAAAPAECRMDQLAWQPCADGVYKAPRLTDGSHVFRVRSTADGTSAFHSFTVDSVAPALTLDPGPDTINDVTATLTFSSPEEGVEFRCAIDSGEAAPCTSPFTTPVLANGTHSVNVIAADAANNQTVASRVLTFAATGPDTTIDGVEGSTKERTPTFALASTRPSSTFQCKVDDAAWAKCDASYTTAELTPGEHTVYARATDAAGNVDPTPAARVLQVRDCTEKLTIGVVEAVADCFYREDGLWVAEDSVKVNGITFNKIDGRKLRFDTDKRKLSLGQIQLRIKGIVLYEGDLEWTVPEGDKVTLAKFNVGSKTKLGSKPKDSEKALDLKGDDGANVQGFELVGEAKLELLKGGIAVLSGNVELPKVFQDAEGNGLTGAVEVKSDNVRGIHLSGLKINAPLVFVGKVEIHNLHLTFSGEHNGDAKPTCNHDSPGLKWEGGAEAIVLPTPNKLRIDNVGMGFADGGFNHAVGTLNHEPGLNIGAGIRVQKIAIKVCAGSPVTVEGRIGLTALGIDKGEANLKIPDAGLIFKAGDPWSLRAEAPLATLTRDRDYTFKDLHLGYASNGAVDFGGKLNFSLGLKGPVPLGSIDAAVTIDASVDGFIEDSKFNAEISAQGCFSGTYKVADTVPVPIPNLCPRVEGLVSSKGIALCGQLKVGNDNIGGVGAGYTWGGSLKFMAGTCDLKDWRVEKAKASAASPGEKTIVLPKGKRAIMVAVRGAGAAPQVQLRGPGGTKIAAPGKTERSLAFTNSGTQTTYVVLSRPRGGRWTITPAGGATIAAVSSAELRPAVKVRARVGGSGRTRTLKYSVARQAGQTVRFEERGTAADHVLGTVRGGGKGTLRFRPADGRGGKRTIVAVVEQDGLPRKRLTVASYIAPARVKPGIPRALKVTRRASAASGTAPTTIAWRPAANADRYSVRVTLPDGRVVLKLVDADTRVVKIADAVSVRVVAMRADNGTGRAATWTRKD